jgi:hypothetical protein
MARTAEEELNRYLSDLRREEEERGNHPVTVASYSDAIARCYAYLGNEEEARRYFKLAGEKCAVGLPGLRGKITRKDFALRILRCGRSFWRAGDKRANEYFRESYDAFVKESDDPLESTRLDAMRWSIVPLIFLEDYENAREVARETKVKYQKARSTSGGNGLTALLTKVIEACLEDTESALSEALLQIEEMMVSERMRFFGQNSSPVVDLHEFVRRKLARSH